MLNILLEVEYFAKSLAIASYLTVISYTYIPKLYTNTIDSGSCSYRLIVKPNVNKTYHIAGNFDGC